MIRRKRNLRRSDIPANAINVSDSEIEKYYAETDKYYTYFTVVRPKYSTGIEYVRKNIVKRK